ncbi:chemotaxis protein [Desulfosarcina alkanivorans]|uniref:Chemotaxis protein n=1 Tax=Desulfosarcina alkanivorans TaxID=571177 RepID=A0A5K7YRQ0_9BACT|nr:hypothetical protein [Desulfosarcina alkanivorans]BBO68964.1 chemotaxis protein [Desulfosarcina alkanivorans]
MHDESTDNPACSRTVSAAHDLPAALSTLAEALTATSSNVGPDFVDIGRQLQSIYSAADTLAQQTLSAVQRIAGNTDDGVLSKVDKLARQSLAELKNCQTYVAGDLDQISAVADHLHAADGICDMGVKIGKFFRILALNIGVESSRSHESRETFGVVAREIRVLSGRVVDLTRSIFEDVQAAKSGQFSAGGRIAHGLEQLDGLADAAGRSLQTAVANIQTLTADTLGALEAAGIHSREISRQVGEIVMGIQLHDSMHQRIAHIAEGLGDVAGLIVEKPADGDSVCCETERFGVAHAIVALQTQQLKHLIAEVDEVHQNSRGAFEEMGAEVGRLASCLAGVSSRDEAAGQVFEATAEDPIGTLNTALADLAQVMVRADSLLGQMQSAATQATQIAAGLSSFTSDVLAISLEIDIKAINAILAANRLGSKGRTLHSLSQEMCSLSDQSREFVDQVQQILESITGATRKMHTRQSPEASAVPAGDNAQIKMTVGIEEIDAAYRQFGAASAQIFQDAEALQSAILRTSGNLTFFPELITSLTAHLNRLEEARQILIPWALPSDGTSPVAAGKLVARYTMQQERDIHAQMIDGGPAPGHTTEPDSDNQEDDEGNCELFSDEPPCQADNLGDNVELF